MNHYFSQEILHQAIIEHEIKNVISFMDGIPRTIFFYNLVVSPRALHLSPEDIRILAIKNNQYCSVSHASNLRAVYSSIAKESIPIILGNLQGKMGVICSPFPNNTEIKALEFIKSSGGIFFVINKRFYNHSIYTELTLIDLAIQENNSMPLEIAHTEGNLQEIILRSHLPILTDYYPMVFQILQENRIDLWDALVILAQFYHQDFLLQDILKPISYLSGGIRNIHILTSFLKVGFSSIKSAGSFLETILGSWNLVYDLQTVQVKQSLGKQLLEIINQIKKSIDCSLYNEIQFLESFLRRNYRKMPKKLEKWKNYYGLFSVHDVFSAQGSLKHIDTHVLVVLDYLEEKKSIIDYLYSTGQAIFVCSEEFFEKYHLCHLSIKATNIIPQRSPVELSRYQPLHKKTKKSVISFSCAITNNIITRFISTPTVNYKNYLGILWKRAVEDYLINQLPIENIQQRLFFLGEQLINALTSLPILNNKVLPGKSYVITTNGYDISLSYDFRVDFPKYSEFFKISMAENLHLNRKELASLLWILETEEEYPIKNGTVMIWTGASWKQYKVLPTSIYIDAIKRNTEKH